MNFLFVDRILSIDPGRRVVGLKHVTFDDAYLTLKPDGRAALLPCLVGEALGQLCAWHVMQSNGFRLRPVAGVVGQVKVLGYAHPGETVLLETQIDSVDSEVIHYQAVASVGDRVILELHDALGPFLPLEETSDPDEVRRQYEMIHRPGTWTPAVEESPQFLLERGIVPSFHGYDSILKLEPGVGCTACKQVTLTAPYFPDHFSRKPVLPLSVLMQCNVDLGRIFIEKSMGVEEARLFHPSAINRVKISGFLEPSCQFLTELQQVSQDELNIRLRFRSTLESKRVCVCEVVYTRVKGA